MACFGLILAQFKRVMPFSKTSSLWELIQERPILVEWLETTGQPVWNQLDWTVQVFCHQAEMDADAWLRIIETVPVPQADSNWAEEPLYRIADYLVADHRSFRQTDLQHIDLLLDMHSSPIYPDVYLLKQAYQSFKTFEESFLEHIGEEDSRIFPHILRLEACERNSVLHPLTHNLSIKTFFDTQGHTAGALLQSLIAEIIEKVREHEEQENDVLTTEKLFTALENFERHINRHAKIETEIFFPRAMNIEKRFFAGGTEVVR